MRKLLVMLLVLCLVPMVGLAQEAEGNLITYDFGDFTMDFDADTIGQISEKVHNQVMVMLYPEYVETDAFHKNLNVVWTNQFNDLTLVDPAAVAQYTLEQSAAGLKNQGIESANGKVIAAAMDELGGKPAMTFINYLELDYSGAGVALKTPLYTVTGLVSDAAFGSYTFTISADSLDEIQIMVDMVNSVQWKK